MVQQIKAFGKSIAVVIWFLGISAMVSGIFQMAGLMAWSKTHGYTVNNVTYVLILAGIMGIDQSRKLVLKSLKECSIKDWMRFIMWGIGAYVMGTLISQSLIQFFPEYKDIGKQFNEQEPIMRAISMVILAPIVEEYLFRWKIQAYLKEGFGSWIAIIGQALLFGGLHYYRLQKIYAAVLGGLFGYVREKKGIAATISMHMTVNLIGWIMGCLLAYGF